MNLQTREERSVPFFDQIVDVNSKIKLPLIVGLMLMRFVLAHVKMEREIAIILGRYH